MENPCFSAGGNSAAHAVLLNLQSYAQPSLFSCGLTTFLHWKSGGEVFLICFKVFSISVLIMFITSKLGERSSII